MDTFTLIILLDGFKPSPRWIEGRANAYEVAEGLKKNGITPTFEISYWQKDEKGTLSALHQSARVEDGKIVEAKGIGADENRQG